MSGIDLYLRLLTIALFVLVGVRSVVRYVQVGGIQHLLAALLVNTLAASMVIYEMNISDGVILRTEGQAYAYVVLPHPLLLLWITTTIQRIPRRATQAICAGLILCYAAITLLDWTDARWLPVFAFGAAFFIAVLLYSVRRLWREAVSTHGVTRIRVQYIVVGTVLHTIAVALLFIDNLLPTLMPDLRTIYPLITAATAVTYFIAFETPAFLRHSWQLGEISQYQAGVIGQLINERPKKILRYLARSSLRAVGGRYALLLTYDRDVSTLSMQLLMPEGQRERVAFSVAPEDIADLTRDMSVLEPRYVRRTELPGESNTAILFEAFDCAAAFVVPINVGEQNLSLLLVMMQTGALFPDEDVQLLRSYVEHAVRVLLNNSLIERQSGRVTELQNEAAGLRGSANRLRDEAADLEEIVVEQQEALRASEEELRRRLLQLSALYRELESFTYSVSHDLRAPLRAITGFATALAEDFGNALPPDARDYIVRIQNNSVKMRALIDDLLKLSQLSRTQMNFVAVDLSDLARRIAHEQRERFPDHNVEFSVEAGLVARADEALARVLLTNLLGNAWKFTQNAAAPRVRLESRLIDGEAAFAVSDNGVGFDMTYADRLFKPFQRLHPADAYEGSGIGLAIVQRIINRHGGRVWAESQLGSGSTFYFTLPGVVSPHPESDAAQSGIAVVPS